MLTIMVTTVITFSAVLINIMKALLTIIPLYQFYQHHHLHHDNIHPHYPLTIKFIPSIITMMVAFHIIMVSFFTIILDYIVLMIISVIFPHPIHNKHHHRYTSPAIKHETHIHVLINLLSYQVLSWVDGFVADGKVASFFEFFLTFLLSILELGRSFFAKISQI